MFQNAGLTWTHIFSPRWSGEGRFGFGRRNMLVGLVDGDNVPIVSFTGANTPTNIGNAGQYPLTRVQNDFQYVYNVATQLGSKHNIRFGTDTRRYQLNENIEQMHRGLWTFNAAGAFSTVENFARGVVQTYQQGFGPKYNGYRTTEVNLYVQDQFRVSPTLSLDLGARFEYVGKPTEVNNLVDLGYGADSYIEPRFGFAYCSELARWFARQDQRRPRQSRGPRRLWNLSRPHLPVDLCAGWCDGTIQSAAGRDPDVCESRYVGGESARQLCFPTGSADSAGSPRRSRSQACAILTRSNGT